MSDDEKRNLNCMYVVPLALRLALGVGLLQVDLGWHLGSWNPHGGPARPRGKVKLRETT